MQKRVLFILCLMMAKITFAQTDSLAPVNYKTRKIILASSSAVLTTGSLLYLDQAWFDQYSTGKFHFFNDNKEWLQMDKAGHLYTNYQTSRLMMGAFNLAGFNKKQELYDSGGVYGWI
jgi:hypothetical protein